MRRRDASLLACFSRSPRRSRRGAAGGEGRPGRHHRRHRHLLRGIPPAPARAGLGRGAEPRGRTPFRRGERDRFAAMIAGLVASRLTSSWPPAPWRIEIARKTTSAIPIVGLDLESDPVASGFVASLARPGGTSPASSWICRNSAASSSSFSRRRCRGWSRGRAVGTGSRGAATAGHRGGGAGDRPHPECARRPARRGDQAGSGARRARACPGAGGAHVPSVFSQSPANRGADREVSLADDQPIHIFRRGRHADGLWPEPTRDVPAAPPAMSTRSSEAPRPETCRSNAQASSSW